MRKKASGAPVKSAVSALTWNAFGLPVESSFDLPVQPCDERTPGDPVRLELASLDELSAEWTGRETEALWTTQFPDGSSIRCERGPAGDHRFRYGHKAQFVLSADGTVLRCAAADLEELAWQRFLLDTVLHCTSLLRGFEAMHASAVLYEDHLIAFVGLTGGGKTSLAAELLRRGGRLFADDVLSLGQDGDSVTAYPGPPLMNVSETGPIPPHELGATLGTFSSDGGEAWVAVDNGCQDPARLSMICLLDRRDGLEAQLMPLSASPLRLLPHSLRLGTDRSRAASRFELFVTLAATTPVLRLEAGLDVPPAALADLVEGALETDADDARAAGAAQ